MNKITIIGSINLDTTLRVSNMPKPGETLHAKEHFTAGGGKGANQAVAAKRSGADTFFIGAIGKDGAGQMMRELLEYEDIDTSAVQLLESQSTGQAFITVDDSGENSIMIFSGANNAFTSDHVENSKHIIANSDFLIAQFESALDSTVTAFKLAKENDVRTILNPAPARTDIPQELLATTDIIIPNETEAELITGIKVEDEHSLKAAADYFHNLGIEAVIITLGSKGAYYDIKDGKSGIIPAFKVAAVDTTAAGDTFIGALSTILKADFSNIEDAILYGSKASSLTVQRYGAQPSIPYKNELD
ncbi:ribokinase [Lactococcus petauri]|uniref:Ribokinase n=1 Tax=Lactococcus petauri TaxID=1940789 RepID=A0AAJ2IZL9_9LACT|nr:ribokinase [Lactococcus petauri]MDT2527101.1 ribokinase [Lactococcus petauri]MDT2541784.1 ribokinase [Lactococcus petauri]MDT2558223.1 ribokinase [Lactococcus petauri]MDT2560492.1 ribokinase [Lactococcus petauri]MDT2568926.1 ribokinase [Lactococcus petauri]